MSLSLGSISISTRDMYVGSTKIAGAYLGSTKIFGSGVDPYNPLGLPQYTIRARFSSTPTAVSGGGFSGSIDRISDDIYDIRTSNWDSLFASDIFFGGGQISPKPVEILGANCTGITSMYKTFYGCSFSSIPLMDTGSVTNMQETFYLCENLTSVPLFNTSNVTSMKEMFCNCTALTYVPLFNTSNVTDFSSMLYKCTALTSAPAFNTSSATNMSYMFYGTRLTTAPVLSTGSVTSFGYMFYGCTSLTSVPQYNMTSATSTSNMFAKCTSVSSGALALYNSVSQQASPPSNHTNMFKNCGSNTTNGLVELRQIPGDWGGLYGEVTCEKYYYSDASTDLAAYSPRSATGYLAGAIWVPDDSYVSSVVYSIKTPATAATMCVYPTSRFYKWNTSTTQSSSSAVKFGAFAIPKANLSRQNVYSSYYGWRSSSEPQFLYQIASVGNAPSSGYNTYTPPANTTYNLSSNPSVPAGWAILLCLYIYTNSTYYFGTVARNNYGYLPYSSNSDLIVQVGDITPV